MSASTRRSLSFMSFTCLSFSSSSAFNISVTSSAGTPSSAASVSSSVSSASSFFSPSARNARELAPERANASKDLDDRRATATGVEAEVKHPRVTVVETDDATPGNTSLLEAPTLVAKPARRPSRSIERSVVIARAE